jgi:hypothetical protein
MAPEAVTRWCTICKADRTCIQWYTDKSTGKKTICKSCGQKKAAIKANATKKAKKEKLAFQQSGGRLAAEDQEVELSEDSSDDYGSRAKLKADTPAKASRPPAISSPDLTNETLQVWNRPVNRLRADVVTQGETNPRKSCSPKLTTYAAKRPHSVYENNESITLTEAEDPHQPKKQKAEQQLGDPSSPPIGNRVTDQYQSDDHIIIPTAITSDKEDPQTPDPPAALKEVPIAEQSSATPNIDTREAKTDLRETKADQSKINALLARCELQLRAHRENGDLIEQLLQTLNEREERLSELERQLKQSEGLVERLEAGSTQLTVDVKRWESEAKELAKSKKLADKKAQKVDAALGALVKLWNSKVRSDDGTKAQSEST